MIPRDGKNRYRFIARLIVLLALTGWTLCASGNAALGQEPQREAIHVEGKLQQIGPGLLQVVDDQGTVWLAKIEAPARDIVYSGSAVPQWLTPGMWVRFQVMLTPRLEADSAVSEIAVFTPHEASQIGVFPQRSLGKDIFALPEKQADTAPKSQLCHVAGRLLGLNRAKMSVLAGAVPLSVPITDRPKILVEISDLTWAQAGDKVVLDGWRYTMVPGQMVATRVSISGASPLEPPRTRPGRRSRSKDPSDAQPFDKHRKVESEPKPNP